LNGAAERSLKILEARDKSLKAAEETQALADATSLYNDLKQKIDDFTADLKLFGDDVATGKP
jgi:t-SNARE complex subunit (syntaxin)